MMLNKIKCLGCGEMLIYDVKLKKQIKRCIRCQRYMEITGTKNTTTVKNLEYNLRCKPKEGVEE